MPELFQKLAVTRRMPQFGCVRMLISSRPQESTDVTGMKCSTMYSLLLVYSTARTAAWYSPTVPAALMP